MNEASWYFAREGKQQGPVSLAALNRLAAESKLQPGDLVWKQGHPDWVPASTIPDILFPASQPRQQPSVRRMPASASVSATTPAASSGTAAAPVGTGGGLWESLLDSVRNMVPQRALERAANGLARWGHLSLFVAMFAGPAWLVLLGARIDSLLPIALAGVALILLIIGQFMARRILGTLQLLVEGTPSTLAGSAFLDILAQLFLVGSTGVIALWCFSLVYSNGDYSSVVSTLASLFTKAHAFPVALPFFMIGAILRGAFAKARLAAAAASSSDSSNPVGVGNEFTSPANDVAFDDPATAGPGVEGSPFDLLGSLFETAGGADSGMAQLVTVGTASLVMAYTALLCLHPALLSVTPARKASLGEEAVGVLSAMLKLVLRVVPVHFGLGCVISTLGLLLAVVLNFGSDAMKLNSVSVAVVSAGTLCTSVLLPLAWYLCGICFYIVIDVIRSILLLPGKLDRLTDTQNNHHG